MTNAMGSRRHPRRNLTRMVWLTAVAIGLVINGTTPARAQQSLPLAVEDLRLDAHLRAIMEQAERNAHSSASPDALAPGALVPGEDPLPLNVNYQRALPSSTVDLIIEGDVDRAQLEAIGVAVNTQIVGVTTAQAPIALLPALLEVPGLVRVSAAARIEPMLDVSADEVDADMVWGGNPPSYTGSTGRNVVVGIVDTGLDLTHADFRNAQNNTRVKYAWHQSAPGTPPAGFTYGAEFTEAQINSGAASSSFWDSDGHGTHISGIAAGNGRATGNGQPNYQYVGVAPEADLVLVKVNTIESGLIDGVNYVFQKAAAMGKKAVVNLSWSSGFGPRDGSYAMDRSISALTGPGKLVTAAAGNSGNLSIHARTNLAAGASGTVQIVIPSYTVNTLDAEYAVFEGWHDLNTSFDIRLRSPSGIQTNLLTPGQNSGTLTTADGRIYVENDVASTTKAKRIYIDLRRADVPLAHPKVGTWTLTLTRRSGAASGICDFWVSTWFLGTVTSPSFSGATLDQTRKVTSPATADSVIATGAYATKVLWTNGTGGTSLYTGNPTIGAIAYFSSQGPRRDGVQRPDIVAPGYGVSAALSATIAASTSSTWKMPDLVHYIRFGTSRANAHTTGALALMLQTDPGLSPSKARLTLQRQARADGFTGTVPNATYGYGKLDLVSGGVTDTGDALAGQFSFAPPYPNPSLANASFEFSLSAGDLASGTNKVELRIVDVRGRLVATIQGAAQPGPQRLNWDGRTSEGMNAEAGVYFAHLVVGSKESVRKFVRVAG
jgi:minor extracellular serine protease Vpr